MNTLLYIGILTAGILALKTIWLITDPLLKKRKSINYIIRTNLVELLILAAQVVQALYLPLPKTRLDILFITLGLILYVSGIIVNLWARIIMNREWGYPGAKPKHLVTQGPFAFTRHPIYFAWLCVYLGFAIAIRTPLIILRIPLIYYFYKSSIQEEKFLEKEYGKEYTEYKSHTRRFFFI